MREEMRRDPLGAGCQWKWAKAEPVPAPCQKGVRRSEWGAHIPPRQKARIQSVTNVAANVPPNTYTTVLVASSGLHGEGHIPAAVVRLRTVHMHLRSPLLVLRSPPGFFFLVACASKPLSGTGHSKTMRTKARRDFICTRGVKRRHSDLGPGAKTCSGLQCVRAPGPGTRGPARTWGSRVATRHWQHVGRQEASPSTPEGFFDRENQKGCISSRKEECPGRPEKPARLRAGVAVTAGSAEGQSRDEPIHC